MTLFEVKVKRTEYATDITGHMSMALVVGIVVVVGVVVWALI